jgi:hypothetical protein
MSNPVRPEGSVAQGASATAGAAMMGRIPSWLSALPRSLWAKPKDGFVYTANFPNLTAVGTPNATQQFSIQIQSDSDFIILSMTRIATDNATGLVFFDRVPALIQLTDTGSGRALSDAPLHIEAYMGDGQNPGWAPFPKRMGAASNLNVSVTNIGNVALNLRLGFHGFKVFGNYPDEA